SRITKTGVNLPNDFHYNCSSLDRSNRKMVNCAAKLKTLQFLYYVQHELKEDLWSVANDEGYDTAYNMEENSCDNIPQEFKSIEKCLPVIPYVRESRRIIGLHTLASPEIKREAQSYPYFPSNPSQFFSTSIAIGDYPIDLHRCDTLETIEYDLENMSDVPPIIDQARQIADWGYGGMGFFQIPFESLIPEKVDGFLASDKNISQSRLANGSTRTQMITMLTGQAAGAIAALSIKSGVQPRKLNPVLVQKELLKSGDKLSIYKYRDVPQDHPYWAYVELASLYGIMVGNNVPLKTHAGQDFGVNNPFLRRDAAVVITRRFKLNTEILPDNPTFSDVSRANQYFAAIEALYRAGITEGCQQRPLLFCPDRGIFRSELAVMLVKVMKTNLALVPQNQIFEDVPPSHYAFPYIQMLAQKGIVKGCSQNPRLFCPDRVATRGEAAIIITGSLIAEASEDLHQ
ncbi:MAG TPA: FAD-dependent oxidoreductase, partial [Thermodesulfobacteriota bacterium]|nr:FAD-dependent oxidoreductase [Thermodesulfobacteriota bacterium]